MDSKKKMYIIIIAVAAAVLLGLIIWAICLSVNKPVDGTKPDSGQRETTAQAAEDTTGVPEDDTTGGASTQPEDTSAETTDATETAETDETKSGSSGNSNPNSGNDNKPDNKPDNEPDNEPDNKPDNKPDNEPDNEPDNKPDNEPDDEPDNSGNNDKPAATEPALPNEYPYTLTYQEYLDMTEKEQIAFYKLFANHNEFKKWRTAAKKEYDENKIEIEIGEDGKIDLGQITGKN